MSRPTFYRERKDAGIARGTVGHTITVESAKNKQSRYRARQKLRGKCDRCGKTSAPFSRCSYHRLYNRVHYALRRLVAVGLAVREPQP